MSTKEQIHRQMTIKDILGKFPFKSQKLSQEITNAGLHCIGCGAANYETLEMGMASHGKTDAQINDLVNKLNALLDIPTDLSTITITPKAAQKFLEIAAEDGKQGWALRFDEQMAGCSGFEYILDFAEKADADDEVFHSNGIDIVIHKKKVEKLKGCEIDYLESLHSTGFKISNPNAKSSCGCGSSHGY
jgi:iron-sulfur cluster assembly accessory protein